MDPHIVSDYLPDLLALGVAFTTADLRELREDRQKLLGEIEPLVLGFPRDLMLPLMMMMMMIYC